MKIIFSNLPMKKEVEAKHYKVSENFVQEYDEEVIFPINAILATTMQKGEKIKVVLLEKEDIAGNSKLNAKNFQKELNSINKKIGAEIEYQILSTPFEESRKIHETLLRKMIGQLEKKADIIADITFGPKSLPIILFAVLNFAEKFFDANIESIIYGKVNFIENKQTGKTQAENPILCDVVTLYYLNSITNNIDYQTAEETVAALDILLNL